MGTIDELVEQVFLAKWNMDKPLTPTLEPYRQIVAWNMKEGIKQSVKQATRTLLTHILEHKFKDFSKHHRQQIKIGNSKHLLKWANKVLDSRSLEEVFDD